MTDTGKENIKSWIDGCGMFDEYARQYVINLIEKDTIMKVTFDKNDFNTCPKCKQHVMTDDKYCKYCGQRISID